MAKKKLKFVNALICDRVIEGAGNKHSLINVYSGDIIVQAEFPVRLPLGFYSEFMPGITGEFAFSLEVKLGSHMLATMTAVGPSKAGVPSVIAIPQFELGLDADTVLTITASADGYSKAVLIKKRVYRGTIPTFPNASPPPSEQSPDVARGSKKRP